MYFFGELRAPILTCKIRRRRRENSNFYAIFQAKILKTGPQFPKISPPAVLFPAKIFQMFVLGVLFPPKNLRMFVWGVLTRGGVLKATPRYCFEKWRLPNFGHHFLKIPCSEAPKSDFRFRSYFQIIGTIF